MLKQDYHLQQIKLPSNVTKAKVKHGVKSNLSTSPQKLSIWSNSPLTSYTVSQNFDNKLTNNTQTFQAPIKRGQRIGSLRLTSSKLKTVSGEPLTYPLYSNESVPKGNSLERLFR